MRVETRFWRKDEKRRYRAESAGHYLIGPNLEADESIWSERRSYGYIQRVATPRNQYASNPRDVVARVEGVPASSKVRLEPGGKVHWTVWREHSDVAEVTGAI